MRRKDREVTDWAEILGIIERAKVCRVGFCDEGGVYIVPLNFGYAEDGGRITLYFHSANVGRKIGLIETSPRVGFEMDGAHELVGGPVACAFSYAYESIIGTGDIALIDDLEEKYAAMRSIIRHMTGQDLDFNRAALQHTAIMKLSVREIAAKHRAGNA